MLLFPRGSLHRYRFQSTGGAMEEAVVDAVGGSMRDGREVWEQTKKQQVPCVQRATTPRRGV